MKYVLAILLSVVAVTTQAKEAKKKYNTHFTNPITDERIEFTACAVSGALYGILTEEYGDVLCWGSLKGDTAKEAKKYYVYKAANRKTYDYYEVIAEKDLGGFGESDMGVMESSVTLRTLTKALEKPETTHQSTLKFHTEWEYSEGSTTLNGKLPGAGEKFSAPVFHLSQVDEELERFAGELEH